jgi:N-acyl-D-aspartate/D-glutamate deacylase
MGVTLRRVLMAAAVVALAVAGAWGWRGFVSHDLVIADVRCLHDDRIATEPCAVAIDGDRITAVTTAEPPARRRVDGRGGVVAPGFLDTNVPGFIGPGLGSDVKLLDGVTTYLSAHGGLPGDAPAVHGEPSVLNYATTVGLAGMRTRLAEPGFDPIAALESGLAAGAYGISLSPEYDAEHITVELVRAICERFGPRGVPVAFHTRYSDVERELDGVREAIACAERGAPVHLLHLASTGATHHPREAVALVDEARRAGRTVLFDFYPYTSWASSIRRARFTGDWLARYGVGWDRVRVPGRDGPLDAASFAALRDSGRDWIVAVEAIPEATVDVFARETDAPIGTDSAPSEARDVHPRGAGSFARFLRRYAADGPDALGPALYRFSTRADERFAPYVPALAERGRVARGYIADLVVWDPETIEDRATIERPLLASAGVVAAIVSGVVVVEDRAPVAGVRDTGRWLRGRFTVGP